MYEEKSTTPAPISPVKTYSDDINDRMADIISALYQLRGSTIKISGNDMVESDCSESQGPANFAESVLVHLNQMAELIQESNDNLNRMI